VQLAEVCSTLILHAQGVHGDLTEILENECLNTQHCFKYSIRLRTDFLFKNAATLSLSSCLSAPNSLSVCRNNCAACPSTVRITVLPGAHKCVGRINACFYCASTCINKCFGACGYTHTGLLCTSVCKNAFIVHPHTCGLIVHLRAQTRVCSASVCTNTRPQCTWVYKFTHSCTRVHKYIYLCTRVQKYGLVPYGQVPNQSARGCTIV
jgi:hypothetical protein